MRVAFQERILVPAYNVAHIPMLEPIVAALGELRCFSLVEVARPDVEKFGAKSFAAVAEEFARVGNRSVARLHLDHVPVIDEDGRQVDWRTVIAGALENGYDSVMIDGSRLPLEENIRVTADVVAMAHEAGRPCILHSCGNLNEIIDDLIDEVGFDGKHSFEDTIEDVREVKHTYGRRMALLGGIDVDFLCRATPDAIRQRTRETLDTCLPGGGYCLGSGNSVTNYIPVDNYLAMLDEGRLYGM